ncbi:MAG: DUF2318 domain-containing protein [Candidatus Altiarchaeota archaeon]|nr:DUF2318 domain-containing protein [Candidatus Altiarchaeota archaeon]
MVAELVAVDVGVENKMKKITMVGVLGVLLLLFFGYASGTTNTSSNDGASEAGGKVKISLSDLSSTLSFYEAETDGVAVKYFAVLGSDGEVRTAFDACDVCGGYKGYEQIGSDIRCINCGRVFKIDGLGTQNRGYGCWPSYLPHELQGDSVLIGVSNINAGKSRFV